MLQSATENICTVSVMKIYVILTLDSTVIFSTLGSTQLQPIYSTSTKLNHHPVLRLLRSKLPCDANVNKFSNASSDCLGNECVIVMLAHRHVEQTGVGAVSVGNTLKIVYEKTVPWTV